MTAGRQTVREQLAVAIAPYMTSAQGVYDHQPSNDDDGSPLTMVLSAGADRGRETTGGFGAEFLYEIRNLVKHVDANAGWTEENAEDALDAMELEVATFVDQAGGKSANWDYVRYVEGASLIVKTVFGGKPYLQESIQLAVRVK